MNAFNIILNEYKLKKIRSFLSISLLIFSTLLFCGCGKVATETGGSGGSSPIEVPSVSDFVILESTAFVMGGSRYDNPIHNVTLSKFAIAKCETTQEEFASVMGYNNSEFPGAKRPVEKVSWYEAVAYTARKTLAATDVDAETKEDIKNIFGGTVLNADKAAPINYAQAKEYLEYALATNGCYRLPTEAEWEYAARGGTSTTYIWGDAFSSGSLEPYAWSKYNSSGSTHPVGEKQANDYGLYDVWGNVWEWCMDDYDEYFTDRGSVTDPVNLPLPVDWWEYPVLRGGSWGGGDNTDIFRSEYRYGSFVSTRDEYYGFRVARTVK